jgi:1,4-dihydroxy-2-naphthoate octaprenyltransferase
MTIAAWVRAARLPAQSNIAPSLLLGQALALQHRGSFAWEILAWLAVFGLLDQFYIVFANDVADVETDRRNRTATPFSGGSRVLPDGALTRAQLAIAGGTSAVLLLGVCGVLAFAHGRPLSPIFGLLALALLWAYSYPPLRLSYRGGGELLQMLGIGVVLPTFGYYAQAGALAGFPAAILLATLPMQLAGAIATALPDAPSDAESRKLTLAVRLGQQSAQRTALALQLVGIIACVVLAPAGPSMAANGLVIAIPLLVAAGQALSPIAVPGERTMLLRVLLVLTGNAALTLGIGVGALT